MEPLRFFGPQFFGSALFAEVGILEGETHKGLKRPGGNTFKKRGFKNPWGCGESLNGIFFNPRGGNNGGFQPGGEIKFWGHKG